MDSPQWMLDVWQVVNNSFAADIIVGVVVGFLSGVCTLAFGNK